MKPCNAIGAALLMGLPLYAAVPGDFPIVPDDIEVSLYARDPLVRNPCGMAFDHLGRLCVGMGPQYRSPKPDTPGDSVFILIDADGDGEAESRKEFATGFNSIQGLAWKEGELWVANAPDLTVVRDVDGDDVADEYVRLYTDLGNLEHALHGLNWGPDGWFYMSKGNSKGLTQPPDRVAPKPFLDLWGVVPPPGTPEFPKPRVFNRDNYQKNYHDPSDDWGRSGGILRCREGGELLEIYSRGFRNPWDISFDSGFHFLGTDNDQTHGDKIFRPFFGADFGWGHAWSYDWKGETHLPTAPPSGPLFEGSGTGVIFVGLDHYPAAYRNIWLINDWLRREVYIYRPTWQGANLVPAKSRFDIFAHAGGGRAMGESRGRSFSPVDVEIGPDGDIYIGSWGRVYGARYDGGKMVNEGRIYRFQPKGVALRKGQPSRRGKSLSTWTSLELLEDLGSHLPVWRANAQEELLRRGKKSVTPLRNVLKSDDVPEALETWVVWTLGRLPKNLDGAQSTDFLKWATSAKGLNRRLQSIRVFGLRRDYPEGFRQLFHDPEPRVRFEAVQAVRQAGLPVFTDELIHLAGREEDRLVYYATWGALGDLLPVKARRELVGISDPGARRAGLLILLDEDALAKSDVESLATDSDPSIAALAKRWLGGKAPAIIKGPALNGARNPAERLPEMAPGPQLGIVSGIKVKSGGRCETAMLRLGERAYTDRDYRISEIPEGFEGDLFVRTANSDAESGVGYELALDLAYDSKVYLAHDLRGEGLPTWARETFTPTDDYLQTTDARHRLYEREVPAGTLTLGPNRDGLKNRMSQYLLIIQPKLQNRPKKPTTEEAVLPLVARGDVVRGRDLFFSTRGANCAVCHKLEGYGNVFAPDLSEIGSRANAEFIVRSILSPSADITEGFALRVLELKDGESVSGFMVEETANLVKIADLLGQVVQVPAKSITKRHSFPMSAMPPTFAAQLQPQQVADLTTFLLSKKGKGNEDGTTEPGF